MKKPSTTTFRSPREAMMMLARAWRPLFSDINSHYRVNSKGKVMLDKKAAEDLSIFSSVEKKLKDSFLQQILADAKVVEREAKEKKDYGMAESLLKEIEALLKSIKREELVRKRQAAYLRRLAMHLGGDIRRIERDVRKEEVKEGRRINASFKSGRKVMEKKSMEKLLREKKKKVRKSKVHRKRIR